MSNYSLVINSQFKPFSYQELLDPVLRATQAHQDLENQYGDLEAKANVWEEMANKETDPYAYKMYKKYSDDLKTQAGQLAREGLNTASRSNMLNMKARYSKEITPIEQAYKRRETLADEQRKMSIQNPTMFYQRNAAAMSLDDFIKNPSLDYGKSYSGALLAQQVGQMAQNLKTALMDKGKLKGIGLPYQYEQLLQYGYTPAQIQQAITNPKEGDPVLNTIVQQALDASGMSQWASADQLNQARAYANEGLYNAIGKTDIKNFTDSFGMQEEHAIRSERRAAAAQQQMQPYNTIAINPSNIYSSKEITAEDAKYKKIKDKYSKYFYKDAQGRIKLSKAGYDEYNRVIYDNTESSFTAPGTGITVSTKGSGRRIPSDFKVFLDSIGAGRYISTNKSSKNGKTTIDWQPGNVGNLWANYIENAPGNKRAKYDATKFTEFNYTYAPEQQDPMKSAILQAARNDGYLKKVDFDSKTKSFKVTDAKGLSLEDLNKTDYKVLSTNMSGYRNGSTVLIKDKNGKVERYLLPAGINRSNENNRDNALRNAIEIQERLKNTNLSVGDRTALEALYTQEVQNAYMYQSQLGLGNKTADQQYQPYGY